MTPATATREAPAAAGGAARGVVRDWWPFALLGVAAAAVVVWAHLAVYPAYSWNRDEPVYLWQIAGLRAGHLTPPDGGAPEMFHPWLSGARDGAFFAQYTLGWPVVLLAGDLLGDPALALVLGGVLIVLGTALLARELTGDRALALTAGAVMVASPILPVQGGVFLGYLFTAGLGLLAGTALLAGLRRGSRALVAVAGGLLGWIFWTRPFDALLWGAVLLGYAAFARRGDLRGLLRFAPWLVGGALPFVVVTFAYNAYVTGSAVRFPITAADPLDTFGFGRKRIMPGFSLTHYTPWVAFKATLKNGFYLPVFLAGSYLALLVAAAGLWLRRRSPWVLLLLGLAAVFPIGYFFFFGMRISSLTARISGPIYLVPLYPPLAILVAVAVVSLWRRRAGLAVLLAAALVAATVPFAWSRLEVNRRISEAQEPFAAAARSVPDGSLVFVHDTRGYLLFLDPFAVNRPELDGPVVYAVDRGAADLELMARMPDRRAFRQVTSHRYHELGPREDPRTPSITLQPLEAVRAPAVDLQLRATDTIGAPAAVLTARAGSEIIELLAREGDVAGRTFTRTVRVAAPGSPRRPGGAPVLHLPGDEGVIDVAFGLGGDLRTARVLPTVFARIPYRVVGGDVELLVPALLVQAVEFDGERDVRFSADLDELSVDARPAARR